MFTFIAIVAGSAVLISGVVAVAYTATKIKNDLDAANSAIADLEASTDIVTSNVRNKVKLTSDGEKIIGLKDGSLIKAQSTLTTVNFDTTEYGDRAVLQLRNDTGSSITLTGLSIRGKPVKQLSGANGYVWEYSDYDDIEKNGENFVEVSNDFIFSPLQAKSIGDFVWKELRPHKMYSLTLIGTQYQYEIGQIWHLTLSYSLDGHTMEDIDTDVEVMGVSLSRSVGGVGTTALSLRVPSAAWELTLAKNAKLVGAGNSQRLANRSNIVTVASSTWTGQADYFCDGTDDDVEIQAAIDRITSLGGGEIVLTPGSFYISSTITIKNNVRIVGGGNSTKIMPSSTSVFTIFIFDSIAEYTYLGFISIDGNNLAYSINGASLPGLNIIKGNGSSVIDTISVENYNIEILSDLIILIYNCISKSIYISNAICNVVSGSIRFLDSCSILTINIEYLTLNQVPSPGNVVYSLISSCNSVIACNIENITSALINTLIGCNNVSSVIIDSVNSRFVSCNNCNNCIIYNLPGVSGVSCIAFRSCKKITNCSADSTSYSSAIGFSLCKSVQQCEVGSTFATKYSSSYADSGTSNPCADTAAGGYNS